MIPPEALALCGALVFAAFVGRSRQDVLHRSLRPSSYRRLETAEAAHCAFSRLSRADDWDYLRSVPRSSALASRMRSERRRVLASYLRQARVEFVELAAQARAYSAVTDSPEIASRVLKATLAFEALHLLLRFEVWAGAWLPLRADVSGLTRRLSALRIPSAPETRSADFAEAA